MTPNIICLVKGDDHIGKHTYIICSSTYLERTRESFSIHNSQKYPGYKILTKITSVTFAETSLLVIETVKINFQVPIDCTYFHLIISVEKLFYCRTSRVGNRSFFGNRLLGSFAEARETLQSRNENIIIKV